MDAMVRFQHLAGTREDQRLCGMKSSEIRGPPGGFMKADAQHRFGLHQQFAGFGQVEVGRRGHNSIPSCRISSISGVRSR
jgi:hypothetical protein